MHFLFHQTLSGNLLIYNNCIESHNFGASVVFHGRGPFCYRLYCPLTCRNFVVCIFYYSNDRDLHPTEYYPYRRTKSNNKFRKLDICHKHFLRLKRLYVVAKWYTKILYVVSDSLWQISSSEKIGVLSDYFAKFKIGTLLNQSGIVKTKGASPLAIFTALFQRLC